MAIKSEFKTIITKPINFKTYELKMITIIIKSVQIKTKFNSITYSKQHYLIITLTLATEN